MNLSIWAVWRDQLGMLAYLHLVPEGSGPKSIGKGLVSMTALCSSMRSFWRCRAAVLSRCLQAISNFAPHFVLKYLPRLCNLLFKLTVFLFRLFKNLVSPFPCVKEPGKLFYGRSAQSWAVHSSSACPMFQSCGKMDPLRSGSCRMLQSHGLAISDLWSWLRILECHYLCPPLSGPGVTLCLYIHKDSWNIHRWTDGHISNVIKSPLIHWKVRIEIIYRNNFWREVTSS